MIGAALVALALHHRAPPDLTPPAGPQPSPFATLHQSTPLEFPRSCVMVGRHIPLCRMAR